MPAGDHFINLIVRRNEYKFFWRNIGDLCMMAKYFLRCTWTRIGRAKVPSIGVVGEIDGLIAAVKRLPKILSRD